MITTNMFDSTEEVQRAYTASAIADRYASITGDTVCSATDLECDFDNNTLTVTVSPGSAWVGGYFYKSTETQTFKLSKRPDITNRIVVALQINAASTAGTGDIVIKYDQPLTATGSASTSALFEMPIAYIYAHTLTPQNLSYIKDGRTYHAEVTNTVYITADNIINHYNDMGASTGYKIIILPPVFTLNGTESIPVKITLASDILCSGAYIGRGTTESYQIAGELKFNGDDFTRIKSGLYMMFGAADNWLAVWSGSAGSAALQTATATINDLTMPITYIKSDSRAIVYISYMAPTGTGGSTITLPAELQGYTGDGFGDGTVWQTGNPKNIYLFANDANGKTISIVGQGAMPVTVSNFMIFAAWCVLYY